MRALHRVVVVFILFAAGSFAATPLCAQDAPPSADAVTPLKLDVPAVRTATLTVETPQRSQESAWTSKPVRVGLLATFAALQVLDVVTTTKAVNRGGYESNPFVGGMASRPALFISVKAAITLWTAFSTEKLAKSGQPAGAVIGLMAGDAAYGWVVAHNYQVLNTLK